MIVTTTSVIQNGEILRYYGVVSTNIVIGTNVFSDFAASLTDFFGGNSNTYQNKLKEIYDQAISDLIKKAIKKGANGIVGLHVDFDEVSGKGKSMFMISALGTPVFVSMNTPIEDEKEKMDYVLLEDVDKEMAKQYYIKKFRIHFPHKQDIEDIVSKNIDGLEFIVYDFFKRTHDIPVSSEDLYSNCIELMLYCCNKLGYNESCKLIYSTIDDKTRQKSNLDIIERAHLFNPDITISIIDSGNIQLAIKLLKASKDYYDKDDYRKMEQILIKLNNLPDKGSISVIKGGLLSKEKEKYICPSGHTNEINAVFCSICDLNIKGLSRNEMNIIEDFRLKVSCIKQLLNC